MNNNLKCPYSSFNVSCIGFNHEKNGTPKQDFAYNFNDKNISISVVADGHGSASYFRSDRGSRFAVECAIKVLIDFLTNVDVNKLIPSNFEKISKKIVKSWTNKVCTDILNNPITEEELSNLDETQKKKCSENVGKIKAYGTTLIALGANDKYCIGLHIGDGKCVAVYEDGSCDEPIPWDNDCQLNKTTSICETNAISKFRYKHFIFNKDEKVPIALFVATDGLDDSFGVRLHSFYKKLTLNFCEADNINEVVDNLKKSLPNITKKGSGDDISISALVDINRIKKCENFLKKSVDIELKIAQIQQLQKDLKNLDFNIDKTNRMIKQQENILNDCIKNYEIQEDNLNDFKNKKNELNNRKSKLTSDIDNLKQSIQNLETNTNENIRRISKNTDDNIIEYCRKIINTKDKKLETINKELILKKDKLINVSKQLTILENDYISIIKKCHDAKNSIDNAQINLEKSKRMLDSLQKQRNQQGNDIYMLDEKIKNLQCELSNEYMKSKNIDSTFEPESIIANNICEELIDYNDNIEKSEQDEDFEPIIPDNTFENSVEYRELSKNEDNINDITETNNFDNDFNIPIQNDVTENSSQDKILDDTSNENEFHIIEMVYKKTVFETSDDEITKEINIPNEDEPIE